MVTVLLATALISLALGALSGFAVVAAVDYPEVLKRAKVVDPLRVRQTHLDWIMMGTVMGVVALAVPGLPDWAAALVLFGGIVNPLSFVPMAFSKTVAAKMWFQVTSWISFVSLSTGLVAAVVFFLAG
jgi:hydroxylaminobenzene mutase